MMYCHPLFQQDTYNRLPHDTCVPFFPTADSHGVSAQGCGVAWVGWKSVGDAWELRVPGLEAIHVLGL